MLADFREGKFNTLVATCIGEEGLDIPQVNRRNVLVRCPTVQGVRLFEAALGWTGTIRRWT